MTHPAIKRREEAGVNNWRRRLRGAFGMALTWGVAGFAAGFGIEMIHNIWPNPITGRVDIWPAALGLPGFFGGLLFSVVLGIVGRRHRFHELSLSRFTAWGAVGGLLVGLLPAAMVTVGLASANVQMWQLIAELAVPCTLGGAVAAAGSLVLARRAEDRTLLDAGLDVADVGPEDEERGLISG
jgi:hypothetical protein